MSGLQFIYCAKRGATVKASHVGGKWWKCSWCGELVRMVTA